MKSKKQKRACGDTTKPAANKQYSSSPKWIWYMYLKISVILVLGCPRRQGVGASKQGMAFRVLSLTQGILFHWIHFHYLSSWTGYHSRLDASKRVWTLLVSGLQVWCNLCNWLLTDSKGTHYRCHGNPSILLILLLTNYWSVEKELKKQ